MLIFDPCVRIFLWGGILTADSSASVEEFKTAGKKGGQQPSLVSAQRMSVIFQDQFDKSRVTSQ